MSFDECYIKSVMRTIPDWPEPGIMFRDITPLFKDPKALRMISDAFIQRYIDSDITHIASIDARGFLIGSIMAYQLNIPLVLVRKKASYREQRFLRNISSSTAAPRLKCRPMRFQRATKY